MHESILIIEDDATLRITVSDFLKRTGYRVAGAATGGEGLRWVDQDRFDLILLDLRLPDRDGLIVLEDLQARGCEATVVIMTAYPEVRTAVQAMRGGAYDYLQKPFDLDDLKALVGRALEVRHLRREVAWRRVGGDVCAPNQLVGQSPAFIHLMDVTQRVAAAGRTPVLIRGESGTGKEHVAHAVHCQSDRASGPWIVLNCSAMPEGLLESELFGHEKGAFTDAHEAKRGLLELAHGGTLFLDEIGDLALALQPKLLRVLETQRFRRLGGRREVQVDVRFVAATNRDLDELMREKRFREDLYYRLNVAAIETPPLRERMDDIPPLADHFLDQSAIALGLTRLPLSATVLSLLLRYRWPGNIRELRNVLERALILSAGARIEPSHLPRELGDSSDPPTPVPGVEAPSAPVTLAELERRHVLSVLEQCSGNKTQAAAILGITRLTLRNKLAQWMSPSSPEIGHLTAERRERY